VTDGVRNSSIKNRNYPFGIRKDQRNRRSEEKEINRFDVPENEGKTQGFSARKDGTVEKIYSPGRAGCVWYFALLTQLGKGVIQIYYFLEK